MNDKQEIEELKNRIAALEAELVRLKATPPVVHTHHHYQQPVYAPVQAPWPNYIWSGGSANGQA
jgi:hypothetical protein